MRPVTSGVGEGIGAMNVPEVSTHAEQTGR